MDTNQFEWNYDARIISKNDLKNVLTEKIIKNAENFVCLMAPFWTWGGVKFLNLIDELKEAKKRNVKIYLFGKSEDSINAKEIFRSFYEKNGIKNCWLVKDLHSKIYYNETYILISSANITKTALNPDEIDIDNNSYNFEDSILLKLKKVQVTEKRSLILSNLNPFKLPLYTFADNPIYEEYFWNKFYSAALGDNKHEFKTKIKIPNVFSFGLILRDWYLYPLIDENILKHINEYYGICPICNKKECKYSKQVICLKHNLPYEDMKRHCSMDCEYFPDFERGEFYDEKCPITVFFCPSTNKYYDPRNNSNVTGNELRSTYDFHDEYLDFGDEEHNEYYSDFIFYCRNCEKILEPMEREGYIEAYMSDNFDGREGVEVFKCPNCETIYFKYCPNCHKGFIELKKDSSYIYCEHCNNEWNYRIE